MRPAILKPKGSDLKSISDFNSEWADRIANLILLGLATDIATLFVDEKFWYRVAAIFANVLIIGGVWGELRFAKRARDADDSRVAEANERAANAELETQRLKEQFGGRHISTEQVNKFVAAIREKASSLDLLIEFQASDPEAFLYGMELRTAFRFAGVEKSRFAGNAYLSGMVFGLWLSASPEIDASSIAGAFRDAEIPISIGSPLPADQTSPNLKIFVGPKPPVSNWDELNEKVRQQQAANTTRESSI